MADNKHWSDPVYRERTIASMREAGRKRRERNALLKSLQPKPEPYHVPDLDGETWADIHDFEGMYMVSNMGRVKSCDRILPHKNYGTWHIKERLLKPSPVGPGKKKYYHVMLHCGQGIMTEKKIHRLVAEMFIPNPYNKPEVNHIDGNTLNNHVSNLEWVTAKENTAHAWNNGLCENIVKAKQRPVINLDTGEQYASIAEAERSFNASVGSISHALNGKHERAHGYRWAYAKE